MENTQLFEQNKNEILAAVGDFKTQTEANQAETKIPMGSARLTTLNSTEIYMRL